MRPKGCFTVGCGSHHSLPSSAEVKKLKAITPLLHKSSGSITYTESLDQQLPNYVLAEQGVFLEWTEMFRH
jgi:hypothetical protein